jgi:hypothetical protein
VFFSSSSSLLGPRILVEGDQFQIAGGINGRGKVLFHWERRSNRRERWAGRVSALNIRRRAARV